jgi:SAM-dependent methyltransferase
VEEHVRLPKHQVKVLDIGCGTARILRHLPCTVEYTGYDQNPAYIEAARRIYGGRGVFHCARVSERHRDEKTGQFDYVLAMHVLHHLYDDEAASLVETAYSHLNPSGVLLTIDCTYVSEQSRFARWLIARDRGQQVRSPEGYVSLVRAQFKSVECHTVHDFLRVPFTHFIMLCRRSATEMRGGEGEGLP